MYNYIYHGEGSESGLDYEGILDPERFMMDFVANHRRNKPLPQFYHNNKFMIDSRKLYFRHRFSCDCGESSCGCFDEK